MEFTNTVDAEGTWKTATPGFTGQAGDDFGAIIGQILAKRMQPAPQPLSPMRRQAAAPVQQRVPTAMLGSTNPNDNLPRRRKIVTTAMPNGANWAVGSGGAHPATAHFADADADVQENPLFMTRGDLDRASRSGGGGGRFMAPDKSVYNKMTLDARG